jgi:hypothetical protein
MPAGSEQPRANQADADASGKRWIVSKHATSGKEFAEIHGAPHNVEFAPLCGLECYQALKEDD